MLRVLWTKCHVSESAELVQVSQSISVVENLPWLVYVCPSATSRNTLLSTVYCNCSVQPRSYWQSCNKLRLSNHLCGTIHAHRNQTLYEIQQVSIDSFTYNNTPPPLLSVFRSHLNIRYPCKQSSAFRVPQLA